MLLDLLKRAMGSCLKKQEEALPGLVQRNFAFTEYNVRKMSNKGN